MRRRSAWRPWCLALQLLLAGLGTAAAGAQPVTRVADLNTTVPMPPFLNLYQDFEALGNVLFFANDDGIHGSEIWRTDGTAAGTSLVKDVCPGSCPARPGALTVWNGLLFFTADDGAHGPELWKTDGTAAGTAMVADVFPGLEERINSAPLMGAGGLLFFLADDGAHGEELWATDGSAAGTRLVKDINPGPAQSYPRLLAASGGLLLLAAFDGAHGIEPWVSDGTAAGTVMLGDLYLDNGNSVMRYVEPILGPDAVPSPQGGFLFAANDGDGSKLWSTDGTPAGTVLLAGPPRYSPQCLTPLNGAVYFAARDAQGMELWKTDGTGAGTSLVKDIWPGIDSSNPLEITAAGNRLFFRASDGSHGFELWTSDGTAAGTLLVKDLYSGSGDAFPLSANGSWYRYGLSALGGDLIFLARTSSGVQLFRTNGTAAGTVPLSPPGFPDAAILPQDSALVAGGRFYFRSGGSGGEIWTSDGTAAGTLQVRDFVTNTSSFFLLDGKMYSRRALAALGSLLFFQADDGTGLEPWRSDGTPGGTWRVAQLGESPYGSSPREIHTLGSLAVFLAFTDGTLRVWSSDGTPGGTQPLSPLGLGAYGTLPAVGGSAFFAMEDFSGDSLWKTDGTPGGTVELAITGQSIYGAEMTASGGKVFFPGYESGGYDLWTSDGTVNGTARIDRSNFGYKTPLSHLTAAGGILFFNLPRDTYQDALWKSDGTAAGTALVKDIRVGSYDVQLSADHGELAGSAGGPLFFAGDDGATGLELWKSDGTPAGTVRIADIFPGPHGSDPRWITFVGSQAYFAADDGVHGREPWVSDGTEAGTRLVADIVPGPGSSVPDNLTAVGSTLLFSAFDNVHGVELWRTGGSLVGTRRVQDIAPGALSSSPTGFTAAGPNVYFAANDNSTGFELWAVPKATVLATFGDVPTTHWAWPYVEALATSGLTKGCAEGLYCPARSITRAEVATSLGRAIHGSGFVPPPVAATRFDDVPASHWAAAWVEQFAVDGLTRGCSAAPPLFCPESDATRGQMSQFLLRALHGADYTPPPATGTRFEDVPIGHWAAAWIEQLAREGITNGCSATQYCPDRAVNRDEMAAFLVKAYHLPLP